MNAAVICNEEHACSNNGTSDSTVLVRRGRGRYLLVPWPTTNVVSGTIGWGTGARRAKEKPETPGIEMREGERIRYNFLVANL